MNFLHIVLALLVNKVALEYALCAACVAAPLYALVLMPLVRWSRHRVCRAAAAAAPQPVSAAEHDTPARPSSASSRAFLSPASASATPLQVTPVFHTAAAARAGRSSTGSAAAPATPARLSGSTDATAARSPLEVVGTGLRPPVAAEAIEYRSPTKRFVSALKRQVQQRSAAFFGRDDTAALRNAVAFGEIDIHRPARGLPSQDYLASRLLSRHQRHALYDELNITDASLTALYASPKFQEWYGANRAELLRDAQLRDSFYKWRSLARAAVLLVALLLLPAFSFSTETNALQWQTSLASAGSSPATVASAPFAQLLLTRMSYIQNARSADVVAAQALPFASYMRADVRTFAATALSMAEWVAIITAVCSLVTSCFMPRGSRRTASVAFTAFLAVLLESALVPGVSLGLGLGTLLIVTVVGTKIRRATG